jgi:hypothetical protein
MHRQAGRPATSVRPFNSRRSREAVAVASADHQLPIRYGHNVRRRIAICDCLLRFANRVSTKLNWGETGGDSSHKHGPQSPWRPVGRELGIRTVEKEARLVSSRMLRPGRGSGETAERVSFESRFATECAGLQIGTRQEPPLAASPLTSETERGQSRQRALTAGRSVCRRVLATLCGGPRRQFDQIYDGPDEVHKSVVARRILLCYGTL